jgi:hypothetical protein
MPLIDLAAAQRVDQDVVGNAGGNGHNDNEPTIAVTCV